jgi:hypothetical protein
MKNLTQSQRVLLSGLMVSERTMSIMVPIEDFQFDPTYERWDVSSTIEQVCDEYEEQALSIFHAGKRVRTGVIYSIDGKQRLQGLRLRKQLGLKCPTHVLTHVFLDTTRKEEAALFVLLNSHRPLTVSAKMKAEIVGEQGQGTIIQKRLKSEGFVVNFIKAGRPTIHNTSSNGIYSATVLRDCTKMDELQCALQLLKLVGGTRKRGTNVEIAKSVPLPLRHGGILYGLTMLFFRYGVLDARVVAKDMRRCNVDLLSVWEYSKGLDSLRSGPGRRGSEFADELMRRLGYANRWRRLVA